MRYGKASTALLRVSAKPCTSCAATSAVDGTVTKQFVAPGTNPIRFSVDGRLSGGCIPFSDGSLELDPELTLSPRRIVVASEENPVPLGFPRTVADGRRIAFRWAEVEPCT